MNLLRHISHVNRMYCRSGFQMSRRLPIQSTILRPNTKFHTFNTVVRTSKLRISIYPKTFQFFSTSTNPPNHYETLGLPTSGNLTSDQIKKAYFLRAKKTHPDLNQDDPNAKEKFQQVSQAYQVLSNPSSKAQYDSNGQNSTYDTDINDDFSQAQETWNTVWQEYGFSDFMSEMKYDATDAVNDIKLHNDWTLATTFANKHKYLLLGIMVPLALTLRHPALIMGGLRISLSAAAAIYMRLPRHQQKKVMAKIWEMVTALKQSKSSIKKP